MKRRWLFPVIEKTLWIGLLAAIHFFVFFAFEGEVHTGVLNVSDRTASSVGFAKPVQTIAFQWMPGRMDQRLKSTVPITPR